MSYCFAKLLLLNVVNCSGGWLVWQSCTKLNTHQNSRTLINLKTTQIKMTKAGGLIKIIPIMSMAHSGPA